jgi:hypothetical protein
VTFRPLVCLASLLGAALAVSVPRAAENDIDALMRQVVARRDDNWKKLQQYVFDEREQFELRGPNRVTLWGEKRDYTWFIRDGFFVRSPVKVNGVTIGEAERQKFEASYLKQQQRRERRPERGQAAVGDDGASVQVPDVAEPTPSTDADLAQDVGGIIKQTRQPQFISTAYFLRFKFEEGKYALVGRETIDGRDVLRVEYYPARMFSGSDRRRSGREQSTEDQARDKEFQRLMNKVALVTLWVEPKARQILKYTFDNVGFDFLPAQWLVHVSDLRATMNVGQPFPEVWLPTGLQIDVAMTAAFGQFDLRYGLDYHDYRVPSVTSKVGIK